VSGDPLSDFLDWFGEIESHIPGAHTLVGEILLGKVPESSISKVYDLADAWSAAAQRLADAHEDAQHAADGILQSWRGDGAAMAFSDQWFGYLEALRGTVDSTSSMQGAVQGFGLEIELLKFMVLINLCILAYTLYALIAAAFVTAGGSLGGVVPAFAVARTAIGAAATRTVGAITNLTLRTALRGLAQFMTHTLPALARTLPTAARTQLSTLVGTTVPHLARSMLPRNVIARSVADRMAGQWLESMVGQQMLRQLETLAGREARVLFMRSLTAMRGQLAKEIEEQLLRKFTTRVGTELAERGAATSLTRLAGNELFEQMTRSTMSQFAARQIAETTFTRELGRYLGTRMAFGAGLMGGGNLAGQMLQIGFGHRTSLDPGQVLTYGAQGAAFGAGMWGGIGGHIVGGGIAGGLVGAGTELANYAQTGKFDVWNVARSAAQGAEAGAVFGAQNRLSTMTITGKLHIGQDAMALPTERGVGTLAVDRNTGLRLGISESSGVAWEKVDAFGQRQHAGWIDRGGNVLFHERVEPTRVEPDVVRSDQPTTAPVAQLLATDVATRPAPAPGIPGDGGGPRPPATPSQHEATTVSHEGTVPPRESAAPPVHAEQPSHPLATAGAETGEAPTPRSIEQGTVRMEDHPEFPQVVHDLAQRGIDLVHTQGDPHVVTRHVIDESGQAIKVEAELHARPGMRFLDLEHELGHVDQMMDRNRFPDGPPPVEVVRQHPDGTRTAVSHAPSALKGWQDPIVEYHNRLVEYIRLAERGVDPAVLREHAEGVDQWRDRYWRKGLKKGFSESQGAWAQAHFPDIAALEGRVQQLRAGGGPGDALRHTDGGPPLAKSHHDPHETVGSGSDLATGAAIRPRDFEQAEHWAAEAYNRFRTSDADIADIARHLGAIERDAGRVGFTAEDVGLVKRHLMVDEHLLDDYQGGTIQRRYDPDPDIAEAWIRLREGRWLDADLVLLEHELAELGYQRLHPEATYRQSHLFANTRYNWEAITPARTGESLDTSWGKETSHGSSDRLPEGPGRQSGGGVHLWLHGGHESPAGYHEGLPAGDASRRHGGWPVRTGAVEDPQLLPQPPTLAGPGDIRGVATGDVGGRQTGGRLSGDGAEVPYELVAVEPVPIAEAVSLPEVVADIIDQHLGGLLGGRPAGAVDQPYHATWDSRGQTLTVHYPDDVAAEVVLQVNTELPPGRPLVIRPEMTALDGVWVQAQPAGIVLPAHLPADLQTRPAVVGHELSNAWQTLHQHLHQLGREAERVVAARMSPPPFNFARFFADPRWSAGAIQFEQRLGAYYFNDARTLDGARAAVRELRDALLSLAGSMGAGPGRADLTSQVERVFFRADKPDSAGQVGLGVPLDALLEEGNVRELMTAFYNAAYFNRGEATLAAALLDIMDNSRWEQARAAGLDIVEVRAMQQQLDRSIGGTILSRGERLAVLVGLLSEERFFRDPFATGHVVMRSDHAARDLTEVTLSQVSRSPREATEQIALSRTPSDYAQLDSPLGRFERAYLESVLGHPLAEETRLPWREGATLYEPTTGRWAQQQLGAGFPVVAGISATTTRMLTAAKFLGFSDAATEALLGALIAWMLPGPDHSLAEILRGAQVAGVNPVELRNAPSRFTAVDLYRGLPGIDLHTLRTQIGVNGLLPHEARYLEHALAPDGFSETQHKVPEIANRLWPQLAGGRVTDADLAGWLRRNGIDPTDPAAVRELSENLTLPHVMALTVYTRHSHYLINNVTRWQIWTASHAEPIVRGAFAAKTHDLVTDYLRHLAEGTTPLPLPLLLRPLLHEADGHLTSRSPLSTAARQWVAAPGGWGASTQLATQLEAAGEYVQARAAAFNAAQSARTRAAAWEQIRDGLDSVTPRLFDEMRWHADMVYDAMSQLPTVGSPERPVTAYRGDWITPLWSPLYGSNHLFHNGMAREFLSVSQRLEVAVRFMVENPADGRRVLVVYRLEGGSARDISVFSSFPTDAEAVFPPGSRARRVRDPELQEQVRSSLPPEYQDRDRCEIIVMEEA
jgi:hypothetical protein